MSNDDDVSDVREEDAAIARAKARSMPSFSPQLLAARGAGGTRATDMGIARASRGLAMSNAAAIFPSELHSCDAAPAQRGHDDVDDDAFRGRILAAMRDLRARERRASSPELRLGDAANDDASLAGA
ncbi:MAG: hypothetical protein NVS3B10_10420 [Polyangiales bacterium]